MPIPHAIGVFWGRQPRTVRWVFYVAAAWALIAAAQSCSSPRALSATDQAAFQATNHKRLEDERLAAQQKIAEDCAQKKPELLKTHREQVTKRMFADAAQTLSPCAAVLNDAELIDLAAKADQTALLNTANNSKLPALDRIVAIEALQQRHPEKVGALAQLLPELRRRDAELLKQTVAAAKKREGVTIGMSKEDVIASSWGKPQRVNRTTNSFGVREQWVYGDRNYLYFTNDKLTSIQN